MNLTRVNYFINSFKVLGEDTLALFYPDYCAACNELLLRSEEVICTHCRITLPRTNFQNIRNNIIEKQFWGKVQLESAFSFFYFHKGERIQRLLHLLKYKERPDIGIVLGKICGNELRKSKHLQQYTMVIPVPLHPVKFRLRGYNQAACFAKGMAESMEISCVESILIRRKQTETQTKKSRFNRYLNVADVFEVKEPHKLVDQHVLLVDDVITTGSILSACSELLKARGAKVSVASIAYANA
jgi:ComF family protein